MATDKKIQLYSLATPNGQKIGIALEEMGLAYEPHTINILKGDQFKPEFVSINPNSKIPAIVDEDGPGGKPLKVFESGAILMYLAEKTGKFLPSDPLLKWQVVEWLMFQMGGVGPMFGQFNHFFRYAPKDKVTEPYPLERYSTEAKRLLGVIEKQLEGREYITDGGFTIADMAIFPWCKTMFQQDTEEILELAKFPNVRAYIDRIASRPAVQRGVKVTSFS